MKYKKKVVWRVIVNANSAIFQLYYGENKLIFNEMKMMMRSALYYTNKLSWIFIVLPQQSEDRHVASHGHIILIPRQTVFALYP